MKKHKKDLLSLDENIKLARLRRKLTAEQVADRAGISRRTLVSIEQGMESVAIGSYVQVLVVLGLADDFLEVGKDDTLGRKLQEAKLMNPKRNS
ncbi:helix-turn-helix domain-containing protein [Saccharicrinis fermentans]|uniref:Transcriptional regulator n=1 Tax=Saccharicrinis fermentans DSM 9555 = JCM 21142 TaxID=869213 RepID=W7Y439_9BACT|nr:helix-turn-helix transcriptional regulator [Saccharicrinis fermentans]GAF05635.1 transcriptional regulator [Saccharicrinis fermentans DSM 9555 = JCM 21142]